MPITPMPINGGEIWECVLNGEMSAGGSTAKRSGNVFYYRRSVIGAGATKAQFAAAFRTAVIVPLLAAANVRYKPISVDVRSLSNATDIRTTIIQAGAGAIATDSEPSVDAVAMVLRTPFRGKNGRGFKHFGGVSEVDTTDDILTGAGLARWQAVQAGVLSVFVDAGGNSWTPFLFSRYMSQWKVNPTVIRGADVVLVSLIGNIGTMKRRRSRTVYV